MGSEGTRSALSLSSLADMKWRQFINKVMWSSLCSETTVLRAMGSIRETNERAVTQDRKVTFEIRGNGGMSHGTGNGNRERNGKKGRRWPL